ncbi:hypothetical protein LguiA_018254 [Lonicera macranthoides]
MQICLLDLESIQPMNNSSHINSLRRSSTLISLAEPLLINKCEEYNECSHLESDAATSNNANSTSKSTLCRNCEFPSLYNTTIYMVED